jgi:hypothetical protein
MCTLLPHLDASYFLYCSLFSFLSHKPLLGMRPAKPIGKIFSILFMFFSFTWSAGRRPGSALTVCRLSTKEGKDLDASLYLLFLRKQFYTRGTESQYTFTYASFLRQWSQWIYPTTVKIKIFIIARSLL